METQKRNLASRSLGGWLKEVLLLDFHAIELHQPLRLLQHGRIAQPAALQNVVD